MTVLEFLESVRDDQKLMLKVMRAVIGKEAYDAER